MLKSVLGTGMAMVAVGFGGCAGLPGSYDANEERVSIRMLTVDDVQSYGGAAAQEGEKKRLVDSRVRLMQSKKYDGKTVGQVFNEQLRDLKTADGGAYRATLEEGPGPRIAFAAIGAAVLPVLAGFAVDAVQHALDAEAERYEAQYGGSIVQDGFWTEGSLELTGDPKRKKYKGTPRYVGFEVVRSTKPREGYDGDAARFVYLLLPSSGDPNLFLIHPFFSHIEHSKAKLAAGKGSASVVSDITIGSVWVDASGRTVNDTVALAKFERGGVKPGEWTLDDFQIDPRTQAAGWFAGVPLSRDADGKPMGTGVFRLTVNVTERDETKAKATIERVSRFIGDNKSKIVETTTSGVNPQ